MTSAETASGHCPATSKALSCDHTRAPSLHPRDDSYFNLPPMQQRMTKPATIPATGCCSSCRLHLFLISSLFFPCHSPLPPHFHLLFGRTRSPPSAAQRLAGNRGRVHAALTPFPLSSMAISAPSLRSTSSGRALVLEPKAFFPHPAIQVGWIEFVVHNVDNSNSRVSLLQFLPCGQTAFYS